MMHQNRKVIFNSPSNNKSYLFKRIRWKRRHHSKLFEKYLTTGCFPREYPRVLGHLLLFKYGFTKL
ncbi:hypothetical protein AAJ76_1100019745 [Vairimorpha ceranae]|uniref:Uncharacterized protein n=1 Tax=Vairimorpha ceranae TaxID=40302 RepID=A0A0F9WGH8_9MICR|nr:hypothetical protein AAJ76_1100019745 [Vairimorpha ceranae]KKO75815.1 hypothetical protein AAJ76_1100019745 [Vairimorpha ceranae]